MVTEGGSHQAATVEQLRQHYNSEEAHSIAVERLASAIFQEVHKDVGLGARDRELLSTAAILHDIGLEQDPETHNVRSREILLETGLSGFGPTRLKVIACIVTFHRKKVKWRQDELFLSLDPKDQDRILKLAAILRVADGLDYTHGQSVAIESIRKKKKRFVIQAVGEPGDVEANVKRANKKGDLWQMVMPAPMTVTPAKGKKSSPKKDSHKTRRGDTVHDAARAIMSRQLERMHETEEGTRAGEDIEALHDMRVATRRLRAALRAFRKPLGREILEPYREELKWVAGTLGRVRDLDVWIRFLETYVDKAPAADREALEAYLAAERSERESLRTRLIADLDSDRFAQFTKGFDEFLRRGPGAADDTVGPFAARSIAKRMKRILKFADGIKSAPEERLHRLRILCKRLRYTGEFFAPCFGKRVEKMIQILRHVQDALGDVHDTIVWRERIGDVEPGPLATLKKHLAFRADQAHKEFLHVWRTLASKKLQKALRKELKTATK